jgi:hypothetical protein
MNDLLGGNTMKKIISITLVFSSSLALAQSNKAPAEGLATYRNASGYVVGTSSTNAQGSTTYRNPVGQVTGTTSYSAPVDYYPRGYKSPDADKTAPPSRLNEMLGIK